MRFDCRKRPGVLGGVALGWCLLASACGHKQARVVEWKDAKSDQKVKIRVEEPAKGAARITQEQVARLRVGMSLEQATQILGPAFFESLSGSDTMMQWGDSNGKQAVHIIFERGRARQVSASGLDQQAEKITRANLAQIHNGTAASKVLELLGPSGAVTETGATKVHSWEGNGSRVMIRLEKDKVMNKMVERLN